MQCKRCQARIDGDDSYEFAGETLCENCYMDALSPTKFCDPWDSYSAESHAKNNPGEALTDDQKKILKVLEEAGGADPLDLMEWLKGQVSAEDGESACATLKRMGKITIENRGGSPFIRLK